MRARDQRRWTRQELAEALAGHGVISSRPAAKYRRTRRHPLTVAALEHYEVGESLDIARVVQLCTVLDLEPDMVLDEALTTAQHHVRFPW
ncbi:hypothetical protein [Saccharothrix syringae]|uniref:Uncharacterized protein n=1 Tax=Saccharothrix syringae TaxID=103733 RepID=A0A5Q0H3K7_SACSY|nr:hypothetical protein [Saccharothrix syringae]QFZ20505.1 hypothetical protein EKG83_26620 [Saccharothrix syringae]